MLCEVTGDKIHDQIIDLTAAVTILKVHLSHVIHIMTQEIQDNEH